MQSHYSVLFIVVLAMLGAGEEALGKPGTHVFPPATVWEDGSGGGLEALGRNEPSRGDEPPGPRGGSKQVKNRLTQEVLGGTHLGQDEHLSVDTQEEEYDPVFIDMDIGRMLEEGTDEDNDNEQDIIMYVDMETGKIWKEMIENGTMTIELEIEEEIREEILIDEREKIEIDNKEEEENETTKEKIEKSYEEEDYYVEYYYEEEEKMQEEYEEYEENDYEEENKDEEEVMYVDMETWKLWKEIIENGTLTIELEERIEERTEEVMINEREKEKKQEKELERFDKEHGVEKDCNDDNRQATNKGIDDQTKREGNDNHKEKDNDSETDVDMETGKIWKEMIENGTMTIELEIEEEIREEILIDEREKIEIDNKEEEENETTKEKIEKSYEEEDYYVEYYYEEEEKMQEEYEEYEENDYEEENKDEEEVMYVDMETWKLWKEIIENGTLTIELEERIEERTEEVMINEREKEKKQEKELERFDKEHGVEKDCNDDNRQATNKGIDDQTKREGNDNHKEKDNDSETDFEDIRVQVTYAAVAEGDVREGPFHIVRIKRKVVLLQLARDASGKITSLPPSHREEVILQTSTPLRQEGYRLVRNGPTLIRADPVIGEDLLLRTLGVAAPRTEEDSGGARRDTVSAGARPSHSSHHRDEL